MYLFVSGIDVTSLSIISRLDLKMSDDVLLVSIYCKVLTLCYFSVDFFFFFFFYLTLISKRQTVNKGKWNKPLI